MEQDEELLINKYFSIYQLIEQIFAGIKINWPSIGKRAGKPVERGPPKDIQILVQDSKQKNFCTKIELTQNVFVSFKSRPCDRWSAEKLMIYSHGTSIWIWPPCSALDFKYSLFTYWLLSNSIQITFFRNWICLSVGQMLLRSQPEGDQKDQC